jgi:hypothetical protein
MGSDQVLTVRIFIIDRPSENHEMDRKGHASCASAKAAAQCVSPRLLLLSQRMQRSYTKARRKTAEIAIFRLIVVCRDQICPCLVIGAIFFEGQGGSPWEPVGKE